MSAFFKRFRDGTIFPWERDFSREVFNIAIPAMIQSLFASLLHIVDNVMIGQLGEIELAAVTQANRITFLFQLVMFGLSGGTASFIAQFWGKRDLRGIRVTMGLMLIVALCAAALFALPAMLIPGTLMRLLLRDETAVAAATNYLPLIAITYLTTAVASCFGTVQRSTEQAKLPMLGAIAAIVTNTLLNYCLIFGHFGFPRLGIRGGAIATVIASALEMLLIVVGGYAMKFTTAAKLSELIPRPLAFVKKYFTVVLPVVVNEGLWSLAVVVESAVYGQMGTAAVAAISIFSSVEQVSLATMRGLNSSTAVLIGKRIGANDEEGAYQVGRRMLYAAVPSGLFAGLVLLTVCPPMTRLFNVSDAVIRDAQTLVRICAGMIWINQLSGLLIVGIMRSGGDMRMSLIVDAGSAWLFGVPLVTLGGLVLKLPLPYVFLLSFSEGAVKASFGMWRFQSRKWIHNLVT